MTEHGDQMLDEGTRAYEASGLHEPNVAWVLSLAAERAMAHGWYERAARLTERENPPR